MISTCVSCGNIISTFDDPHLCRECSLRLMPRNMGKRKQVITEKWID